jgi:hypothetical protein
MPVGICLPFEILIAIAEEVDDAMDLYHLRTASHAWCAAATPFAFRALSVITTKGSAENIGRLFDLPDIAPHIREVSYHDTSANRKGRDVKPGTHHPHHPTNDISNCLCTSCGGSCQSERKSSTN